MDQEQYLVEPEQPEEPSACYVQSAPALAVMQEQLEYLVLHKSSNSCPLGCEDCMRLEEVESVLFRPFINKATPRIIGRASAPDVTYAYF